MSEAENKSIFSDDEAVRIAREAFSVSDTYFNASIRNNMERDIRQVQGVHPHGSKYHTEQYRTRSKLFRPKTLTARRKAEAACAAAYFSTEDVVSIAPQDPTDDMQHASAAINKELLQYRLTNSVPWFQIVVGAFQEARTVGVVASLQTWKYDPATKTDKPVVTLLPPENVRVDPAADWTDPVNGSPYVILQLPMYIYQIKERIKSERGAWLPVTEEQLRRAVKMGDSIRNQRENQRQDSKDQNANVTDFALVWVHHNFVRYNGKDYCYYTLNETELLSKPRLVEEAYPHLKDTGERPIVFGKGVINTHKVYPDSHPTMTRDVQSEINTIANQRIDNVKLAMDKRWFVRRDRQVDVRSLLYGSSNSVTMMNDVEKDVRVVETNDVTSSSYAEQDRLNLDFDDLAGAFSGSSVQSNRRLNETVGGMQMMNANANQIEEYDLKVFSETWVEPVIKQLVLMEQAYETDEVILAIAGQKAKLYQKFGMDAVTDILLQQKLTIRVNVGTGSTNTYNQLEKLVYGITSIQNMFGEVGLMRLKQDEVIKEVFGKLGYKDGGRFYMPEGENPEIDGLIQQIQALQQAIAQKHPPELIQAQIKEINARAENSSANKVKILVESIFSAMQAAGQIAMNPMIAPVGDKVMEAAGYQNPNPAGVDPNIPVPAQNMPVVEGELVNTTQETGGNLPEIRENTSPAQPPVPASPMQGIETQDMTD